MDTRQKIPYYTPSTTSVRPHYVKQHIRGTSIVPLTYRDGDGNRHVPTFSKYKRSNNRRNNTF